MLVCFLVLVVWQANHIFSEPHYTVVCVLPHSTVFFHIISYRTARLRKKP